jgi:hypothetical protein
MNSPLRKTQFDISFITKDEALSMVQKFHYSNTLPRLNKHFVGFKLNNELVGVVTLGWGTRPLHTIKKLFPSLESKDYYEIGRMCMTESMPKNSESQMLSQLVKFIKKELPQVKVLFTWSDGMLGKVGYVYQASNFQYAGFYETDCYIKDGVKLHPRQTKAIFCNDPNDKRLTVRPTLQQLNTYNIQHIKGKQFKYLYFLCDRNETKRLQKESLVQISINYPKENDLAWRVKNSQGKWVKSPKPFYKTDLTQKSVSQFLGVV